VKVLIIDDDPLIHVALRHFLEKTGGVDSIRVAKDGVEALKAVNEEKFDAVFLDLELPEVPGAAILKSLPPGVPTVIVSAHKEFAAESYDFDVTDYLVKPLEYARFHRAWQKVLQRGAPAREEKPSGDVQASPDKQHIFVRDSGKLVKVALESLLFLKAESNYTQFVSRQGRPLLVLASLKQLEESLPAHFLRVHRSYIANLRCIEHMEGDTLHVEDHRIPIGESFRAALLAKLPVVN
jgi:DNA-binding LytR/AlgR family response regulator